MDDDEVYNEQTIFPATEYLKGEIMKTRSNIGEYLRKYRLENGSCSFSKMRKEFYFKQFVNELILLYSKVRPSIFKYTKSEEFKDLKELDKSMECPSYKKVREWINIHLLLDSFLFAIGISRLEMDKDIEGVWGRR